MPDAMLPPPQGFDAPGPIWSEEAEHGVLAAVLTHGAGLEAVADRLAPEHFCDPAAAAVYRAALELMEAGTSVSAITVARRVEHDPDVVAAGGPRYMAALAAAIIPPSVARDYADIIRDCHVRRTLRDVGASMMAEAAAPPDGLDGAGLLRRVEETLFTLGETGRAGTMSATAGDALEQWLAQVEETARHGRNPRAIPTGLTDLDRILAGGWLPGRLYVVGGRPAMGKSGFGFNTAALTAAQDGKRVLAFSLEMPADEVMGRMLARASGVPLDPQQSGQLTREQWRDISDARARLAGLPLTIDYTPAVTPGYVRMTARRHKRRHGLDLLLIDHLHLMRGSAARRGEAQRLQELSEITGAMKAIAKELEIPVVVLAQLSRAVEQRDDKRPQLSDLRESGSIEQDADAVLFVYRQHYYLAREEPQKRSGEDEVKFGDRVTRWERDCEACRDVGEIIAAKVRGGRPGTVRAHWDGPTTTYSNLWRGDQP